MLPVSYRKLKHFPAKEAAICCKLHYTPAILLFLSFSLDLELESAKHSLDMKEREIERKDK